MCDRARPMKRAERRSLEIVPRRGSCRHADFNQYPGMFARCPLRISRGGERISFSPFTCLFCRVVVLSSAKYDVEEREAENGLPPRVRGIIGSRRGDYHIANENQDGFHRRLVKTTDWKSKRRVTRLVKASSATVTIAFFPFLRRFDVEAQKDLSSLHTEHRYLFSFL